MSWGAGVKPRKRWYNRTMKQIHKITVTFTAEIEADQKDIAAISKELQDILHEEIDYRASESSTEFANCGEAPGDFELIDVDCTSKVDEVCDSSSV